jgi:CBS domain-containing protein
MKIGSICSRTVVIANKGSSVAEVAKLMRTHHVGCVVVVEEGVDGARPVGVITDRDLVVEVIAQDVPMNAVALVDVMSRDPIVAREEDDLWDTLRSMREKGIRRSPVVNAQGLLIGLVSVDDMLDLLAEELNDLVKLINQEQRQERKTRSLE